MNPPPKLPSLNDAWLGASERVLRAGMPATCRGRDTIEVLGAQSVINMQTPVLSFLSRRLSYEFMCAEACWILSGSCALDFHPVIEKNWKKYSDNGTHTSGAYGPKVLQQIGALVNLLCSDPFTRQAVISYWRENPVASKDIACTLSTQFLIREWKGQKMLHLVHTMRSSDLWLGYPYDVFNFCMLAAYVALHLPYKVKLGMLVFTAGSQHIYKDHYAKANEAFMKRKAWAYAPLNLEEFHSPHELLGHLSLLSYKKYGDIKHKFLQELEGVNP